MSLTKFEEDLKAYFPDIYRLHQLGKAEEHIWDLVEVILSMRAEDVTGRITIFYNRGHIDQVRKDIDVLAHKTSRPGHIQSQWRGEEER